MTKKKELHMANVEVISWVGRIYILTTEYYTRRIWQNLRRPIPAGRSRT
jgi:hypothetical protein